MDEVHRDTHRRRRKFAVCQRRKFNARSCDAYGFATAGELRL